MKIHAIMPSVILRYGWPICLPQESYKKFASLLAFNKQHHPATLPFPYVESKEFLALEPSMYILLKQLKQLSSI